MIFIAEPIRQLWASKR